jgi:DNA invertase Pin-like site-specific DNA recombinase
MKYLIYLRVSTEKQDEEYQLSHCLNFIRTIHEGEFEYEVFRDKITSKKKFFIQDKKGKLITKRDGGRELLCKVSKGDIIIAIRLDRITRSLYETTHLIKVLDDIGANIRLVDQPGIQNKIMLGLYAGMAEEEINLLRRRVSQKLEDKKNNNERYSRHLPYGYRMHETKLVPIREGDEIVMKRGILIPIHEEQETIRCLHELQGLGLSYRKMARVLQERGHVNREGNAFSHSMITKLLKRIGLPISQDQPHGTEAALVAR